MRRIIRRALRHGNKLGCHEPFFYKLVGALVQEMGEAYPELVKAQAQIEKALLVEEEQFAKTLSQGLKILEDGLADLTATLATIKSAIDGTPIALADVPEDWTAYGAG